MSLHSLQIERHCLSGLLKNPGTMPDIDSFAKDSDFHSRLHRTIFSLCRQTLMEGGTLDKVVLAQKMEALKVRPEDNVSIYDYLDNLAYVKVTGQATIESFREIAKLRILRDIAGAAREIFDHVKANQSKPLANIITECDGIYGKISSITNSFRTGPEDIMATLPQTLESLADNPLDEEKLLMGPLPTVNRLYGSLHRPGNITIIVSRSKGGKTAFSMFYNLWMAERYGLPILWMDMGEMSKLELQVRAACMLAKGAVPFWAIEQGRWRENPQWKATIQALWPRVKKMRLFYEDVSHMGPMEVISLMRRFAYAKAGKGNVFLACYDYLKPFDLVDKFNAEWQQMGRFLQNIKSFINGELPVPFLAPIQSNRKGIVTGRNSEDVDDSEDIVSISDRVTFYCSHSFLLRNKTPDELGFECSKFGNRKMIPLVNRFLGRDAEQAIGLVSMGKNKKVRNCVNLDFKSFHFEDKGDLNEMMVKLKEKFYPSADAPQESGEES